MSDEGADIPVYPTRLSDDDNRFLLTTIRNGAERYLTSTTFGIGSVWRHGDTGKIRAERLSAFIARSPASETNALVLLITILNCRGWELKATIAREVQCSGVFRKTFADTLDRYLGLSTWQQQVVETLRDILDTNYELDEKFFTDEIKYLKQLL